VKSHIASNDAEASHTQEALKRQYEEKAAEIRANEFRKCAAETRVRRSRILDHSGTGLPLYNEVYGLGRRANDAAGTIWAGEVESKVFAKAATKKYGYITALYRKNHVTFVAAVESHLGRTELDMLLGGISSRIQ
jgi:hypothetical protein